jgi:excisionase family DNA binding protein
MKLMTPKEVGEIIGASDGHVRALVRAGKLRGVDISKGKSQLIRISQKDLDEFLERSVVTPLPKAKRARRAYEPPIREFV